MRATLEEVLGACHLSDSEMAGRIDFHTQPGRQIWVAECEQVCVAHLMARMEEDALGTIGTIYVWPNWRGRGLAELLLDQAENWLAQHGARGLQTLTHPTNHKLHRLFQKRGYQLQDINQPDFVRLFRGREPDCPSNRSLESRS
jgi:GNAT superfamily N-acetyltransferase